MPFVKFTQKDRKPRIFKNKVTFSSFHSPFTKRTGLLAPWKHKFLRTRRAFSCNCLFWAPLSSNNTSTAPGVLTTPCWPSVKNVTLTSRLSQHSVTPRVIDLCLRWALLLRGFSDEKDWRKFVYRIWKKMVKIIWLKIWATHHSLTNSSKCVYKFWCTWYGAVSN